jgi:hypothetical protein
VTRSRSLGRDAFAAVGDVALSSRTDSVENLAPNCPLTACPILSPVRMQPMLLRKAAIWGSDTF